MIHIPLPTVIRPGQVWVWDMARWVVIATSREWVFYEIQAGLYSSGMLSATRIDFSAWLHVQGSQLCRPARSLS